MTKLTEKVTRGKRGWKVRVTWSIDGNPVVWCDGDSVDDAREGCEWVAKKHGILNRP